jgi:hypothetical protein
MAEAERYLPGFAAKVEDLLTTHGLRDEPLVLRITGCPNGCARPYLAEVALIGKAPGRYNLYLGGDGRGQRLNALYRENVDEPTILAALDDAFGRFAAERTPRERFGDFAWRAGLTVVIAVLIGVIVGAAPQPAAILAAGVLQSDDHDHTAESAGVRFNAFVTHVRSEFFEMVRYLIFGALLAAGLQTFVPQETLAGLGSGPLISVVALSLLAALLSVCSTVDAFIALSFTATFTPGAILAFLVFGPMIDIKSTLMLTSTFSRRTVISIALLSFVFSVLAGTAINVFGG